MFLGNAKQSETPTTILWLAKSQRTKSVRRYQKFVLILFTCNKIEKHKMISLHQLGVCFNTITYIDFRSNFQNT